MHSNGGSELLDDNENGVIESGGPISCVKCSLSTADGSSGNFFPLENTQCAGYCRQCFLRVVRHKFAFCLGKNRVFKDARQRDALLVHYPGDLASLQLNHLTRLAVTEPSVHKRLRLNVKVLFLSSAPSTECLSNEIEECRTLINIAHNQNLEWDWHFAHEAAILEPEIYENLAINDQDHNRILNERKKICKYFELFDSGTSCSVRAELSRLLRTKLICRIACRFQCATVLLPDNADSLAQDVLNALCFGRGSSISDLSAMVDGRFAPLQFVRPLRV